MYLSYIEIRFLAWNQVSSKLYLNLDINASFTIEFENDEFLTFGPPRALCHQKVLRTTRFILKSFFSCSLDSFLDFAGIDLTTRSQDAMAKASLRRWRNTFRNGLCAGRLGPFSSTRTGTVAPAMFRYASATNDSVVMVVVRG